jgi:hypothetical protein
MFTETRAAALEKTGKERTQVSDDYSTQKL